jgi:hypothetical protein
LSGSPAFSKDVSAPLHRSRAPDSSEKGVTNMAAKKKAKKKAAKKKK